MIPEGAGEGHVLGLGLSVWEKNPWQKKRFQLY
jgi:hypothetical protein